MRWSRFQRRILATLGMVMLAGGGAGLSAVGASAAEVYAGETSITSAGRLGIGPPGFRVEIPVFQRYPATAAVDSAGAFTVTSSVSIASDPDPDDDVIPAPLPIDIVEDIRLFAAAGALTGTIDPAGGAISVGGEVVYSVSGTSRARRFDCTSKPTGLLLTGNNYNPASGTATIAPDAATFAIPDIEGGTSTCDDLDEEYFENLLDLEVPGLVALSLDVTFTPAVTGPAPPPPEPANPGAAPNGGPASAAGVSSGSAAKSAPSKATASPSTAAPATSARKATKTPPKLDERATVREPAAGAAPYVWRGGSRPYPTDDDTGLAPDGAAGLALPPAEPQPASRVSDSSSNVLGIGAIVVIVGLGAAGVVLVRGEARRFFRRRERASF